MATKQAWREEEERERLAEEAKARAEEEARIHKEEERFAMEQSLWEVEGSSKRKAAQ